MVKQVRYLVETEPPMLTKGKIYDVLAIENGWYRIIDDSEEDYLYPPEVFEIINERVG